MIDRTILAPLTTLLETPHGAALKLTPRLLRLYGSLRMRQPRSHPHVFSNFVTSLDGVVSLQVKGHVGGGDISGFSLQDRMVMGLLRAVADVVIVGSGTLEADPSHLWTPEHICPELSEDYRRLRAALRKPVSPLNVIVSGSGGIDLRSPVFASGRVPALLVTTTAGARRIARRKAPRSLEIIAVPRCRAKIPPSSILDAVGRINAGKRILIEGGPRLLGDFYARRLVNEQFLTLAPQIVGRDEDDGRFSLVMGHVFAPGRGRWGTLTDVRRGVSHLFLRYALGA